MAEIELTLSPELAQLERLDSALENAAREFRFSEELAHGIRLCAHEVFTNIVTHGFDEENYPATPVEIKIIVEDSSVKLRFLDRGRAYNPVHQPDPEAPESVEDAEIGGLGVKLVKAFSSGIVYSRESENNSLEIEFQR